MRLFVPILLLMTASVSWSALPAAECTFEGIVCSGQDLQWDAVAESDLVCSQPVARAEVIIAVRNNPAVHAVADENGRFTLGPTAMPRGAGDVLQFGRAGYTGLREQQFNTDGVIKSGHNYLKLVLVPSQCEVRRPQQHRTLLIAGIGALALGAVGVIVARRRRRASRPADEPPVSHDDL